MNKKKSVKKPAATALAPSPPIWKRRHFLSGTVFLFSFFLFANSIFNGYNLDDELVTRNHRLTSKGTEAIPEIFTSAYYQDNMGYAYEYRPIVLVSFAIEHQLFGDSAFISHFFNVLLYALCCLLLLKVLKKLLNKYPPILPFAITLLFAAHTSHTEVVDSIKNRDEILGLGFALLALFYALKAAQENKLWAYMLIPVFYSLALLSKATIISFALIIPLAIIFFYDISWIRLAVISLLLSIFTYIFVNVGSGYERLQISMGLLSIIGVFSLVKNANFIFKQAKKYAIGIFSAFSIKAERSLPATGSKLQNLLSGIIPDKSILSFPYIFITLCMGLLYFFFIYNSFTYWIFFPIGILILFTVFGNKKLSWWGYTILLLCLIVNIVPINNIGPTILYLQYTDLLAMVLALGIYWGRRELFLPSLAGFCLLLAFMKTKHISEYLIALAGAYLIQFKYVRIILIIVIFIFLVYDPYLAPHIWDWGKISGLIFLLIVHFTNKFYESFLLVISGALLIILTAQLGSDVNLIKSSQQFAYTSFTKISATSNRINPQIAPKTQNRPVLYVENCVAKSDNLSIRAGTSLEILFCYLEKTILPYPLAFYYGYRFIRPQNITESVPLLSFILYLLLLILAIIFSFRYSLISFGLFIYLFSIVVFSNYFTYIAGMMGDRFLLIPSLGWCIALAGVLYRFSNLRLNSKIEDWRNINPATKYFFMIVLLSYSVLTFSRNMDWKNDLSLFRKDIRYVNMSSQAHNLLALHLMQHAETEQDPTAKSELEHEALGHFKEALQIYPRFFNVAFDIGRVYMALNMPDSAINAFKYATTLDTLYPELYKNLGELYFSKQMYGEAATYYAHMITFSPSEYLYYGKLSYSYFLMKDYEKSLAVNKKALAVLPGLPDPYINTSRTYLGMNKTDSAVAYLKTANRLFPNNAEIQALLKQVGNK